MDLTPPSLTNSPYSPHRKSLDSPPPFLSHSGLNQPSEGRYAEGSCGAASYAPLIDPNLSHSVDVGSPFARLGSIPPSVAWSTPNLTTAPSPPASTTSSMPSLLASEYDQFGTYEPSCLTGSYGASTAYAARTASHSPAFMQTPPPSSGDLHEGDQRSFSSRNPFGFMQDSLAKPRMGETLAYSSVSDGSHYHHSRMMTPGSQPQMFLPGELQSQHHTNTLPSAGPLGMDGGSLQTQLPTQLGSSSTAADSNSWTKMKKSKRRPTRRHTTKEEANFQCMVKGCGKFFSRSYNFKSHMETHDEKREYPFPCQVTHCTKKFVRKTDLQRHHQSVHAKERNHKCDYCSRHFARKDTLRRHMEDGCAKRFEVGMLEGPADAYSIDSTKMHEPRPANMSAMAAPLSGPMVMPTATSMAMDRGMSYDGGFAHRVDTWR